MADRIMDGGDILIEVLNNHGVDHMFGSPGSEWPPLWEALSRRKAEGEQAPTYLNCRHEGLAIGAALGYHRGTGKLVAVPLHTNSGALNCATNLRGAMHDFSPLVVLAGESIGYGEMDIDPGPQWLHSLSSIGGPSRLMEDLVKWQSTVRTSHTLADTFHRACQIAQAEPQGPVLVNPPMEIMLEQIGVDQLPVPPGTAAAPQPDVRVLEQVAHLLIEARNPVIFTEAAGKDPASVAYLTELAELLALPVIEPSGADATNISTEHPLHLGYDAEPWRSQADLILLLACPVPWHPPSKRPAPGCKVVDIGVDPDRHLKPYSGFPCDIQVHGQVKPNLQALLEIVRDLKPRNSSSASRIQERESELHQMHRAQRQAALDDALAAQSKFPIEPNYAAHAFNEAVPDDAVVVTELITHRGVFERHRERSQPGLYLRSFGGLGQGLPNALGMKVAHPDRLVVCAIGDGSFFYNPVISCYGMCQEYDMPILTVVFNNHGYASQQGGVERAYPGGFASRDDVRWATSIKPRPEYAKLLEAFGGSGQAVDQPADIIPAIRKGIEAVQSGQPAIVDIALAR